MNTFVLTGAGVRADDVASVARDGRTVEIAAEVFEKLSAARNVLDRAAAGGQRIYGLNTGLGANLRTAVTDDQAAFQRQLLDGRSGAVGDPLPTEIVRATMFARAAMLAVGGSGISPDVLAALVAALNAGVHPIMPRFGSIGAGDLVVMAAIGCALIGEGEAEFQGQRMAAAEALEAAGLKPAVLAPKDGLSLINASSVSVGFGSLVVRQTQSMLDQQAQAAALTMEAIGANRAILDERVQAARPAPGQAEAAKILSDLMVRPIEPSPDTLQDPLSIRCVPSIHGALIWALDNAMSVIELELNSAGDNPLVLIDDDLVLSTGNFHTPAIALAFETLGLAIAQAAAASGARFIQLTGSGRNGLPKYLSPVGGASAGFVPLQKTMTAILAAIRHKANPVMLDFLPVSEGVEDHATQTLLAISKCAEITDLWRRVVVFEMMAAAQAVDLRGAVLADGTADVHAKIRSVVAPLNEDRPLGPDAEALHAALSATGIKPPR